MRCGAKKKSWPPYLSRRRHNMLVRNKKTFGIGVVFALSFLLVLLTIFSPIFKGKNGLRFADDSFNRLSKGSSHFIPRVSQAVEKSVGRLFSENITLDTTEGAVATAKIFTAAGAAVDVKETELRIDGDLGTILQSALKDADSMFHNRGDEVSARYGFDEKSAMKAWWTALGKIEKKLKKNKHVEEANVVSEVMRKAIEPGYNFYGVEGEKVADHAGILSGLLVFYVAYTLWWGYAIFYIFNGLGLTMKKAKVKKEA
jgi:hypothetical protein